VEEDDAAHAEDRGWAVDVNGLPGAEWVFKCADVSDVVEGEGGECAGSVEGGGGGCNVGPQEDEWVGGFFSIKSRVLKEKN
jgi:hypothetical protein